VPAADSSNGSFIDSLPAVNSKVLV
jgi:hypothetical protein